MGWGRCGLRGEGSRGVEVGEGVIVLIVRSLRRGLAFNGLRSLDVSTMSSDPVVVLWAGVVSFFFDPVAFCITVGVFLDADLGNATVNVIYLPWGPCMAA